MQPADSDLQGRVSGFFHTIPVINVSADGFYPDLLMDGSSW